MATVHVQTALTGTWKRAIDAAIKDLNALFKRKKIAVKLVLGKGSPLITVVTDAGIVGSLVHGKTHAEQSAGGVLTSAEVKLPVKMTVNTPDGERGAGAGFYEVTVAHEFVHALGQEKHSSMLMTRTWQKKMGDTASGDKLGADSASMPPLDISDDTVELLQGIWGTP